MVKVTGAPRPGAPPIARLALSRVTGMRVGKAGERGVGDPHVREVSAHNSRRRFLQLVTSSLIHSEHPFYEILIVSIAKNMPNLRVFHKFLEVHSGNCLCLKRKNYFCGTLFFLRKIGASENRRQNDQNRPPNCKIFRHPRGAISAKISCNVL
jgi:hypothetical protein